MAEATDNRDHLWLWRVMSGVSLTATLLTGLGYIGLQLLYFGRVADAIFVFIITLNAGIGAVFGYQFEGRLRNLIHAFNAQEEDAAHKMEVGPAFRNIFNHPLAVPVAIGFASFVAGWVYLVQPWVCPLPPPNIWTCTGTPEQSANLNRLLAVFLFFGNLMIGYGLYSIGRFWLLSARRIAQIRLNIFNPTRPDIAIYQDITKRVVILVAVVATLAMISLPVSLIQLGVTAVLFSISALAAVAATYLVPMMPLTAKFTDTRAAEMNRVEQHIDALYEQMMVAEDPTQFRPRLDEFTALREQVRKVKTLPPGGEFSIFTAVGVSFLTFLPTIFEKLLGLVSF